MYDKHPNFFINEIEPDMTVIEHTELRLYDIATTEQFDNIFKVAGDSPNQRSQRVFNWAKAADMKEVLKAAGYEEDESTEDSNKLLKLALMTPYAIYTQHKTEAGNNSFYEELAESHQILKEAVKANPHLNPYDLAFFLQGVAMEAGLPIVNKKSTERIISEEINAVRSELNFEMIMQSEAMRTNHITYEAAGTEEDEKDFMGADGIIKTSFSNKNYQVGVQMPVNIKSTAKEIASLNRSKEAAVYAIEDDTIVAIWSGVDLHQLGNRLLIDEETAEAKAGPTAEMLRTAAASYYREVQRGEIRTGIGRVATRIAS